MTSKLHFLCTLQYELHRHSRYSVSHCNFGMTLELHFLRNVQYEMHRPDTADAQSVSDVTQLSTPPHHLPLFILVIDIIINTTIIIINDNIVMINNVTIDRVSVQSTTHLLL